MNELLVAGWMAAAPAIVTGYPKADHMGMHDQTAVSSWRREAADRSLQAVGKKVGDVLLERFELKGMEDPRRWTPATALVGGAYVAAAGMKLDTPVPGGWRLALRLLPIRQTGKLTLSRRF